MNAPVRIVQRPQLTPSPELLESFHPTLARVYASRGLSSRQDVDYALSRLHPFDTLHGLTQAVALLERSLREQWRVIVVGDFDADGATGSTVALRGLRALGLEDVSYLVPNRFEYGYGLTPELVAVAAAREPQLLITVDNGISSVAGAQAAHDAGLKLIVTDHHLPGDELPLCDAIVNPNQAGDRFPSKAIAGVGVVFYLLLGLRAHLRESGWFAARGIGEPNFASLLDLVALGTVADVVPLDVNNRVLVAQGLKRIRAGRCAPGITALLEFAGRAPARSTAQDLGFAVGPRLNAAGRLSDMALGIECLLCDEPDAAHAMAKKLDELNRERREIESEMRDQALAHLEALPELVPDDSASAAQGLALGLCLYQPEWHQGVIGILAARIKDRLHRPVIVFADAGDGEPGQPQLKGSARSVSALNVRDAIDAVAVRHPGLVGRYGGHAMAAGLSLPRAHFEAFADAFDEEVRRHLRPDELNGTLETDGSLDGGEIDIRLAHAIRAAGPWGQDFPEPLFDGEFGIESRRIVGEKHLKLTLRAPGARAPVDAIAFNVTDGDWPSETRTVRCVYRLDVNFYRGSESAQLMVEHIEPI
ncbi:MAG: single-stranded-DNA-specific exonuclease RecJ [Gammaproteobacteria bacterium]